LPRALEWLAPHLAAGNNLAREGRVYGRKVTSNEN